MAPKFGGICHLFFQIVRFFCHIEKNFVYGKGGTRPPLCCCKTISRVLFHSGFHRNIAAIYLGPALLQGSISLPFLSGCRNSRRNEQLLAQNLFDLSTHKVYHALVVTNKAVSFYLTFSPLPRFTEAVYFLWHCLSYNCLRLQSFPLGSMVLCVARTFLRC